MGNQALNPCISAIDDEMRATQDAAARNTGSPKHNKLLNRLIGIAASSLTGNGGQGGPFKTGKGDLGELIVRQVQEKVMDIIKDQVFNPSSGLQSNMLMKLNQYLRPADLTNGSKQIFNVSILSFNLLNELLKKHKNNMYINKQMVYLESDKI